MGNIHVLGFELANLIAAGEVVDRPASVLKELLENAIDAGATRITAEIKRGGVSLIRVSDNGCGMAPEDLPIAIRRHATSKIRVAEDLDGIATLGFRGEALAAISAVSELRIMTKTKDAPSGTMLVALGGAVSEICEVGTADGTTVAVENLFAAVPARRKFLKKDATETMACSAVVEKIAMSRPDISFTWITDGTQRFKTTGDGELHHALYAILGRDFATHLLPVQGDVQGVLVQGFIGSPDHVRNNRNHQNIFINGRYVKSKTVMAALEKAYVSYIAPERFPVCALFLTVHPQTVDVNVHPAKLEVKFSDERVIFEAVYYAVRSVLENDVTRPSLSFPLQKQKKDPRTAFVPVGASTKGEQLSATKNLFSAPAVEKEAQAVPPQKETDAFAVLANSMGQLRRYVEREHTAHDVFRADGLPFCPPQKITKEEWEGKPVIIPQAYLQPEKEAQQATEKIPKQKEKPIKPMPAAPAPQEETFSSAPDYRFLGEAFSCYLFVEREKELLLIDKHAAHERILFEELLTTQKRVGCVASQGLLVSLRVALAAEELAAAEEYRTELEAVGFSFTLDHTARIALLSAVPEAIAPPDAEALFVKMAAELAEGAGNPAITEEKRRERALYQVACKAAIKGGRHYGEAQIQWLLDRLMAMPDITVCPHGRPIAIRLTKTDLDKQFDRIM